jgi:predicted helicase
MTLDQYIENINKRYQLGNSTEHTFRGDLQLLIESLVPSIRATNEPKRQACGAPDYILTKKDIPIGFIEAKDLGDKDLEGAKKTGNKEQFDRYKASLNNLIFTDYLDFHLYREGQFVMKIAIAEITDKGIKPLPENFSNFEKFIKDFCTYIGQGIKSSIKLAEMMAGKVRLLADVIEKALTSDENNQEDSTLKDQMKAFKQILIHDITPQGFADVYAQTIAYGMFAARYHDPTLPTFSRQEAFELIPKSNPFLKKLFGYIAGLELDERIKWIVDDLVQIFLACNVAEMLKNYGKSTKMEDPIIHFYEDFLSEYDPKLRKARGVWYTPAPVVNFIVRAVDDILKTEFDLPQGLADNGKTSIKIEQQGKKVEKEVHKVQLLDPATGTGTFLAEVIKHIHKKFEGQQGLWSNYVETHLLPRLNGFELLMASYAMAHLQLDLLFTETGYKPTANQRLRVYLTNSLEESHPETGTLFAQWLSNEANEANHIKRDVPVMCVIGNPPYAVSSTNKGEWIQKLISDYKKNLNETKINLDDDYIKFIRYGQHFIDKNGSGVLAYISNNSFIDGITHRQMRKHLLESFDKIYILDLHGNAKKKELSPDGSPDQNVFDIMQGVSINIFVKTGKKKKSELGEVYHFDLQGKREYKYDFLRNNSIVSLNWLELNYFAPNYFFVPKNFNEIVQYEKGFKVNELFVENISGVESVRDAITIQFDIETLKQIIHDFVNLNKVEIAYKYKTEDARDWKISRAKEDVINNLKNPFVWQSISYRPFDIRKTFYSGKQNGFVCNGRYNVMRNLLNENIAIVLPRLCKGMGGFQHGMVSKYIVDRAFGDAFSGAGTNIFPLYLYPDTTPKPLSAKQQAKKLELEHKLAQEKEHFTQINIFFHKTVLPFFNAIPSPDENAIKLFEENKATFEEAKALVEGLENQLEAFNQSTKEKGLFEENTQRVPNFNLKIVNKIAEFLGLIFTNEKELKQNTFAPIDLLDYIYAVLHSPSYRTQYKEFLKIDFPRIPFPKNKETFWQFVKLGGELRQIHLLESPILEKYITQYPIDGNNLVDKVNYQNGKVYINDIQYFENVPQIAWEFNIGGYQPAQKWLKDRKGRKLEFEDILHYQKIIVALAETDRLMQEINKVDIG